MKPFLSSIAIVGLFCFSLQAQIQTPPNYHTDEEIISAPAPVNPIIDGITDPPDFDVRPMAEWEEIQSLIITWAGFNSINKNIARYAKEECEVIILSDNPTSTENYLMNSSGGGPLNNMDNITILDSDFNSIWGRDYGGNTCYREDVQEPILVDWIYNRVRPADDATPAVIANYKGIDLYETTVAPYDMMATGGNFMSDGYKTAFSSELIMDENEGGFFNGLNHPDHTEAEIDDIVNQFMGVENYIKMDNLPFDLIHHIDMHMKILDEETIVVGEYPNGVADGPQIEANIEYILSNHTNSFGTPYKIERIIQPPENGSYPNTGGDYRTYSNMVFVNKTVILPVYEEQYDEQALETLHELLPGYNIETIVCNDIIPLSGAIHCITKAVGVDEPLWIATDPIDDTFTEFEDQTVQAIIKHKLGIAEARMFWKDDINGVYVEVPMTLVDADEFIYEATIPGQEFGTTIYYYINGVASDGKTINRPMPAPEGYFSFKFIGSVGIGEVEGNVIESIYPNPATAITVIPLTVPEAGDAKLYMTNSIGQEVLIIKQGSFAPGEQKYFIDAGEFAAGVYNVVLEMKGFVFNQKLVIE
ncbi:MAG: agmatine deiminase [Patiriisocius sp.]|jgi:agmatine deiminase